MPGAQTDRRRFQRIQLNLPARFLVADCWLGCTVTNISGSGAWLRTLARPLPGSGAVLHSKTLGTLTGIITRHGDLGVSMKFGVKESKMQSVAARLDCASDRYTAPLQSANR